jgi:hypothetical protein
MSKPETKPHEPSYGTSSNFFAERVEDEGGVFEEEPRLDDDVESDLIEAHEQEQVEAQEQFAAHAAIYACPRTRTCEQCQEQPATKFHDESALSLCDECFGEVREEEES